MGGDPFKSPGVLVEPLTRRESEILALLAQDLSNDEIAGRLTLSLNSVKWHVQHIYEKLGVNRRRQAIVRARELGLLGPAVPAPSPAHNLPDRLSSFIGREREIARVKERLACSRLVTLTGAGGVGKTRLALQCARQVLDHFPHGAWLVELAPILDAGLVLQTVAGAFGLRVESGPTGLATLQEYLRRKRCLLVLDNCEHLIDECARLAEALLQACHLGRQRSGQCRR